ncbi:SRPBCC family protein [Streptomyces sp. NPDC057702]|uniref:SRPBCC family protein n=1 Tax=unclassified Streptomyces TaxID=2593676 RepID=UPI0036C2A8DF
MAGWYHYRFRSSWVLGASADAVYAVLERVEEYPDWWPQVRAAEARGDHGGVMRFRSLLPYDLRVVAHERRRDPVGRVLEIAMDGDLDGWARWTVRPQAGGRECRAVFEQEVELRKPLLRRLGPPCRPFLVLNHALMMRGGQRGLRALLAGGMP